MSRIYGEVFQNGYVVRDLEAALRHWTEAVGVGPFYVLERVPIPGFVFRGTPSPTVVSVALAFSGGLEIELIEPHGDAPSMYRDFLAEGREGLHHLGFLVREYDAMLAKARAAGMEVAQSGSGTAPGTRFCYLGPEVHRGTVIELIEASEAIEPVHAMIREAAHGWDGGDPVRKIEIPKGVGN